jgi:hypothetical protein
VAIVPSTTVAMKRHTMVRTMSAFRIDVVHVSGCAPLVRRRKQPDQLEPCVTVPLQERRRRANALEAHDAFHPAALNVSFPTSRAHGRPTVPTSPPPLAYL